MKTLAKEDIMQDILQQNIFKDLGLDALPEKEQKETLLKIGEIIFQRVLVRVYEELSDKDASEFERLITNRPDDENAILNFLYEKIENLDRIVSNEIAKFKRESLDFLNQL
jgi:hypothetical protein